jgi:glycosyltransferase involved in cell wall biosynthesis
MAKIIGLIYGHNENWIAGSYYIQNLVHALGGLAARPQLKIYAESQKDFERLQSVTGYSPMTWVPLQDNNTVADRIINKLSVALTSKHLMVRGIDTKVHALFPATDTFYFDKIKPKLFWIPDFQEKHYPNFFSSVEILKRRNFQQWIVMQNHPVVFSSNHSSRDFYSLYPDAANKTFVMPFAVTLPDLSHLRLEHLKEKFDITTPYFICSNQFWAHKNHLTVLNAIARLKSEGIAITVLFTGKPYDNRNPEYYPSLEKFIRENGLYNEARFLGFIDRGEQLLLMKNSLAIVQPSLFEGWSTVVEDSKALGVPIIVSDIPVHREQLPNYMAFFEPLDFIELASWMKKLADGEHSIPIIDYKLAINAFAARFMDVVEAVQ